MAILDISGSIVGAGSATAGLVLVFLGSAVSSFESYQPQERRAVLSKHKWRSGVAFAALLIAVSSVIFGLLSDALDANGLAWAALSLLLISLLAVVWAAGLSVRGIK